MSTNEDNSITSATDNGRVLTAMLPGKTRVHISTSDDDLRFDDPVYAINWFDTKMSWIYDFYNMLANRSVVRVGGAPFFKGRLTEIIHGDEAGRRDVLLVVRYPSLTNFKTMLESKYFLIVSLLRIVAVKNFTFGFTKRRDAGPDFSPLDKNVPSETRYLVCHFKGESSLLHDVIAMMPPSGANVFYAGSIGATISTGTETSTGEKTPCLMDNIMIIEVEADTNVTEVVDVLFNPIIVSKAGVSFIGIFNRVM